MAARTPKYPLGSPQEHIEMCKTHDLPIDVICEDCDEFICGKCAKTDHKEHEWSTLPTAATQRRRGLLKFLKKIKEKNLHGINEKIEKVSNQITENKELCDTQIKKLQRHVDEIMARLTEIRENNERRLTEDLEEKNKKLNSVKSELNKRKKEIEEMVMFMEDNNSTMSDYGFLDNHRELMARRLVQNYFLHNDHDFIHELEEKYTR
ncbi:transcription intermediary factor 1-beta-like, partial [Saccostrea cucullata]